MATKFIDFSCKHDVLIRNPDGSLQPMDEPYYEAKLIAPDTWCVLSDGDFTYLLAGDTDTLTIDSGYGAGNIREYLQTLTDKPVRWIANTHHHLDHTANNAYFDKVFMAKEGVPLASIASDSFLGINFPRDYEVEVIGEGYKFDLGNREIEVFAMPDHAVSSLVYLDKRARILFAGDEITNHGKGLNGTVENFVRQLEKLMKHRSEFDSICCGSHAMFEGDYIDRYLANARYILDGHEGVPAQMRPKPPKGKQEVAPDGKTIYERKRPRRGDGKKPNPAQQEEDKLYKRVMDYADCTITYDIRRIRD